MDVTLRPESLSLINLFKSCEIFQVPSYQRPYSWGKDEICKLWDDILEAYGASASQPYFLGSIIVIDKGNGTCDIVDGQQRMTTLTILFDVLNKISPNLNRGKDSKINPLLINNRKLTNCISNDNENCRLRLQTKPAYCSDFESAIIDANDFSKYKITNKSDTSSLPVKERFENCAAIFYDAFNDFNKNEVNDIGELANFICNNIYVIKITCSNVSFAIKMFQVLNNRGLDLAPADIIKGYLMDESRLSKEDENRFTSDWNEIEKASIDLEGENLTSQFTYFLYYLLGKSPKRTIVEEYEDIIKGKSLEEASFEREETCTPIKLIKNFKNFFEKYEEIDDSGDSVIVSFYYLPWKTFWATCLLTAKHRNYSKFNDFAKELRRFLYISYICGYSLNQLKKPLLDLINAVKTDTEISQIKAICRGFLKEKDYLSKLKTNLTQKSVFGEAWLKPVLLLINNSIDDAETLTRIPMDSHLHIEHILPRKFESSSGWSHIPVNEGYAVLNTFGNLTLLGYKKNIKAQNYSFEDKLKIYEGNDGSGKWTCYNVTRNLRDFAENNVWNLSSIEKREKYLLTKLGGILEIDCLTEDAENK